MRNYCIYRISCTIQLLCFFFFAIMAVNPEQSNFYGTLYPDRTGAMVCQIDHAASFTLPVIALIVITILNDGTIITIAYDRVIPAKRPQKWALTEVRLHTGTCDRWRVNVNAMVGTVNVNAWAAPRCCIAPRRKVSRSHGAGRRQDWEGQRQALCHVLPAMRTAVSMFSNVVAALTCAYVPSSPSLR